MTILELLLMLGLLVVILAKTAMVADSIMTNQRTQMTAMEMEDRAREVLDRIAEALMQSNGATLDPGLQGPNHSPGLTYQFALGLNNGQVVWSDDERIERSPTQTNRLLWTQNPDQPDERSVAWTNALTPFLEGEIGGNGLDDNGNGLTDETGVAFEITEPVSGSKRVRILLTLERPGDGGEMEELTVETEVTPRN